MSQIENKCSEIDTRFTRFSEKKVRFPNNRGDHPFGRQFNNHKRIDNPSEAWRQKIIKKCEACQTAGEPLIGHDLSNCPNVRPSDRTNLIKSFNLEIDPEEEDEDEYDQCDDSGFTGNVATVDIETW